MSMPKIAKLSEYALMPGTYVFCVEAVDRPVTNSIPYCEMHFATDFSKTTFTLHHSYTTRRGIEEGCYHFEYRGMDLKCWLTKRQVTSVLFAPEFWEE